MNNLKIQGDADSVGPLPNVPNYMPYSGTYNPLEYIPMPFYTASEHTVYGYNREESVLSGSGKLGWGNMKVMKHILQFLSFVLLSIFDIMLQRNSRIRTHFRRRFKGINSNCKLFQN